MSYRFMSCNSCGTRLRFMRKVQRSSVKCPLCGTGMELSARDMVSRSDKYEASDEDRRHVPPPEFIPAELLAANRKAQPLNPRNFLVGLATATVIATALIAQGVLRIS